MRDAGYYTIDALRIEAGRRAWGAELSPDETPWEAGLGYAVKMDKPTAFLGRDALAAQQAAGVKKRLVLFTFDDPAAFPWGGEPILMDGRNVGELTSAGYSRKHGRAVAMGYARGDRPLTDEAMLTGALPGGHRRRPVRGDAASDTALGVLSRGGRLPFDVHPIKKTAARRPRFRP